METELILSLASKFRGLDAAHSKNRSPRHQACQHLCHQARPRQNSGFGLAKQQVKAGTDAMHADAGGAAAEHAGAAMARGVIADKRGEKSWMRATIFFLSVCAL